jgi:hypothetical protein
MWFAYIHCWATYVFSVLCSDLSLYKEKPTIIERFHSRRPPVSHLILNGRNISYINSAKYLSVIFDRRITWRLHIEII